MLLVGPVAHAGLTARFLTSFRKSRALEEVVATPLTPRRVLDALAVHGGRQTLRTLLPPLVFCAGLFWLSGWPAEALLFALLPACWGVYWFFALLAVKAWDGEAHHAEFGLPLSLARMLGTIGPLAITAWLGGRVAWSFGPFAAATVVVLSSILWALVHREVAVRGLDSNSRVRRALRRWSSSASRRPHSFLSGAPNALLFREQASRSGTLQQRFLGGCLWGMPLLALLLAWLVGPEYAMGFFATLWPLLGMMAVLRVLQVSSVRLHDERQQGSLDLLLQTGLTVQEFVQGCVGVAAGRGRRLLLPFILATSVAILSGFGWEDLTWWPVVWMAVVILLAVEAAAVWGTSMAADCRQRPQPSAVVVTFLTAVGIGWMLASSAGFLLVLPVAVASGHGVVESPFFEEMMALLTLAGLPIGLLVIRQVALVSARKTLSQKGRTIGFVERTGPTAWHLQEGPGRGARTAGAILEQTTCASGPVSGGSR